MKIIVSEGREKCVATHDICSMNCERKAATVVMGVIIIDGMTSAQNALKEIDNAKKKLDQAIENYKFALTQLGNNRITIKLEGERDEKSSQRGVLDE